MCTFTKNKHQTPSGVPRVAHKMLDIWDLSFIITYVVESLKHLKGKQMETLMLTAGDEMQAFVNRVNEESKRRVENRIKRATMIKGGHEKLMQAGVNCIPKEIGVHELDYGFTSEVKHVRDWGKIHKAVGKLEVWTKEACESSCDNQKKRGKRKQMIKLVLTPVDKELNGNIKFYIFKQLTDKDKCQVKVVKSSRLEVVCNV
jgi:hypothetical protein